MTAKPRVRGQARLEATLAAAASDLAGPALRGALSGQAAALADLARGRAPRRSGALAGSIRPLSGLSGGLVVAASAPYAPAIELGVGPRPGLPGGHNIAPRRFMAAAAAAGFPRVVDAVAVAAAAPVTRVKGA